MPIRSSIVTGNLAQGLNSVGTTNGLLIGGWQTNTSYFGSTVDRYGTRIACGKFILDGESNTHTMIHKFSW